MYVLTIFLFTVGVLKTRLIRTLLSYEKGGVHMQEFTLALFVISALFLMPADPFEFGVVALLNYSNVKKMVEHGLCKK